MTTAEFEWPRTTYTAEQMHGEYHVLPWHRRLPRSRGSARWVQGWIVRTSDGQHALLQRCCRNRRPALQYDLLRFSGYKFTDWSRADPQSHLPFGSHLANEHQVGGRITEMQDGVFVFQPQAHRQRPNPKPITCEVVRSITWIEEREE